MSTRDTFTGAYLAHKGRPDPTRPGFFICSRCGARYNEAGQTVDAELRPVEHPDDCTTKQAPK